MQSAPPERDAPGDTTNGRRRGMAARGWVAPVSVGCLVVLCGAAGLWARGRPPFSDAELAAATRSIGEARTRLTHARCRRPALAPTADATTPSLAALLDPTGANGECLQAAAHEDVSDALTGVVRTPDGRRRRWVFDVPGTDIASPPGELLVFTSAGHPPFPEGEEPEPYLRVRAACGGVASAVTALAGTTGGCSPYAPGTPGWLDPHRELLQLARAISIVARGAARDGDLEGALTLLVRAAAVIQDVRRGPTSLITAMVSVAAETKVWSTFNSLLIPAPGPPAPLRAKLSALIDQLIEAWPHPHDVLLADALAITELVRTVSAPEDERALALMLAGEQARRTDRWCPRDGDPTRCFASTPRGAAPHADPGALLRAWHFVAGPNARARRDLPVQLEANERSYSRYWARLLSSVMAMRIMKVMLALSGARQEGACPTRARIDPRLLEVPFATGRIEISNLDGPQYEVTAPRLTVLPGFERIVFNAVCPAVGGRWQDAADEPTSEDR